MSEEVRSSKNDQDIIQKVKGFRDIYGDDNIYWQRAESVLHEVFRQFNIEEIRLPMLESTSLFSRGVGSTTDIVEKEMFTFVDRDRENSKGEMLPLRPEGTAGTVRAYIENKMYNPPLLKKLYYLGPMFRRERPQKARFRQFTQGGIEFLASATPITDAEVINVMVSYFKALDIDDMAHMEINSVGCRVCRPPYHEKLVKYLSAHTEELCEDCNRRLSRNPLRVLDCKNTRCIQINKNAPFMPDHLCDDCSAHYKDVKRFLKAMGIEFKENPMMVRGLDYYVRTAFEMVTDKLGAASAAGAGGRYDGLAETLGGPEIPGIGFAIGIDRVVELMKLKFKLNAEKPDVFVIFFDDTADEGVALVEKMRKNGIRPEFDYELKGMKNQLKKADRSGAGYAVILGENEAKEGKAILRDLTQSAQEVVEINNIIEKIKKV